MVNVNEMERIKRENEELKRKLKKEKDDAELEGMMIGALYGRTMGRSLRMEGTTEISSGGFD